MRLADLTGARRVPLIGRRNFLEEARRRHRQSGVHLLYYEGEGGIGKTALLEAILERCRHEGEDRVPYRGCIADEIIDLYHVDAHTTEGLIRRIVQVLGPTRFRETQKHLNTLDWARSVGNLDVVGEEPHTLHSSFLQEFAALAQNGVVLAFDTMEVLEYERDPFQLELGERVPTLSVGEWLFGSFFPALQGNVLLLLAGRPDGARHRLYAVRERNPRFQLRCARVEALLEEEAAAYLKTVAQAEGELGDFDAAARLWDFAEERGDVVHLLTGGRPILLALVADLVGHGWTLPPSFGRSVDDLGQHISAAIEREIESALIVRIQESPSPTGEVLQVLAWLRKGATPALLARVMGLTDPSGDWDLTVAQGYLDEVARLALVKVRAGDGRVFLHDELYALMEKYVLRESSPAERDRVFQAILHYYDDLTADLEARVDRSSVILPLIHGRLRQAYVEQMHYMLRHRPYLGFAMYLWLADAALGGRDAEMDMLLRSELLRTAHLLEEWGALSGLDLREVELDTAVRWGMRALFLRHEPEAALLVFDRLRQRWEKEAGTLDLAWTHMLLYQAAARIERAEAGDWHEARTLLQGVRTHTDEMPGGPQPASPMKSLFWWAQAAQVPADAAGIEGKRWLARTLKAQALNYEGYLDQQQGRYAEALRNYQASAMLQRRLAMAGLAPTLTNLSYTMALMGEFQNARLLAQEAERWARHSGKNYVLALALNARALVEVLDHHHRDALRHTEQALYIADGLRAPRVRGLLLLTRARAHRYLLAVDEDKEHEPAVLDDALKEANQAVNLLKDSPPDRVMALIERGCMLREMARGHHLHQRQEQAVRAARSSQGDLERAGMLAAALELPDQQASAWTDLGWLWYHTGQMAQAHEILRQVYSVIPADYLFPARGGGPLMAKGDRKTEACLPFWIKLGNAEMLKAFIAFDLAQMSTRRGEQEERLNEAAGHITLALAYNELFGDDHFDMTEAEAGLHRRILQDKLSITDLHRYAGQAAGVLCLVPPTRFQRFLDRMFGPADLWA